MNSKVTKIEVDDAVFTQEEAQPFVPRHRPAYPKLTIIDDGEESTGEVVRLRKDSLAIGRSEGDLQFPAERMMTSLHARISLDEVSPGSWQWVLHDLESRHGVFIRFHEEIVSAGNEILIGGTKIIMHGVASTSTIQEGRTKHVPYVAKGFRTATAIVAKGYAPERPDLIIPVERRQLEFGAAVQGPARIVGDSFVDPKHLSLRSTDGNSWTASDLSSLNGTWLRIRRLELDSHCEFMVGEQRFLFNLGN